MTPAIHCQSIVKDRIPTSADVIVGRQDARLASFQTLVGTSNLGKSPVIVFSDVGGQPPHPSLLLDYPMVQVFVQGPSKSTGYTVTYDAIRAVQDILLGLDPQLAPGEGGDWIVAINGLGAISYLGTNPVTQEMHQFTWNLQMIIEPAATRSTNRIPIPGANPQAILTA